MPPGLISTKHIAPVLDPLLAPLTYLAARWLKLMRQLGGAGFHQLPRGRRALRRVGLYPLRDHYYEPFFAPDQLHQPLEVDRDLPAIDLNVAGQLQMLNAFNFADELIRLPITRSENTNILL